MRFLRLALFDLECLALSRSERVKRAVDAMGMFRVPVAWAVRLSLRGGPFRRLRGVPLKVLCAAAGGYIRLRGL